MTLRLHSILAVVFLWAYALGWALIGNPIYRDQHLGAAIEYSTNGIDLLRPVVLGFNATGTGSPQEFPIWQAAASLGMNAFGGWWGGATVASLLLFSLFLPCFYKVADWEAGSLAAAIAVPLLLAQPIVFHLAGGAQTDGLALAFLVGFIWSAEFLRRSPSFASWVACTGLAALLAITKMPFLMVGGIAAAIYLLWKNDSPKSWALLASAGILAILIFLPWNSWCDSEIARAEFKYRPLTISENPEWFFGSLTYRFDPKNYIKAGWRALGCLWGSFVLVGLTIYGLYLRPKSLGSSLLVGAIFVTLIFTQLVLTHRHYYLMFAPAVALLNTYAIADLASRIKLPNKKTVWLASLATATVLLLSLLQGLMSIEALNLTADPHMKTLGSILKSQTNPQDRFLVINGGWGGDLLIHSNRQGLSIDDLKHLENPESSRRLKELGYNKLAIASESPVLHAVQVANLCSADLQRISWQTLIPEKAQSWPTLHESEDLIIKQIPYPNRP
jgi:4-amino-4-deoxy-L-arabinose transferase-like glycosyltransferase